MSDFLLLLLRNMSMNRESRFQKNLNAFLKEKISREQILSIETVEKLCNNIFPEYSKIDVL